MWDKRAEYLSTTDDGKVKMVLDQGFGDTKLVTIELLGVYTSLADKIGEEVKKFIEDWFDKNTPPKGRWGFVVTTSRVDDNRYLAVVAPLSNETTLNAAVADLIYDSRV